MAAVWNADARRNRERGKTGVLMGGAKLNTYGLTMRDAQFVESHRFSVEEVARMFNMAASLLGAGDLAEVEQDTKRFLSFGLGARLAGSSPLCGRTGTFSAIHGLYPQFYTRDFIRLDAATEAEVRTRTSSPACCSWTRPEPIRDARRCRTVPGRSRRSPLSAVPLTRRSPASTTATATERAAND
jgi:hypothetical protein